MEFNYEVTVEDYIQFNQYHAENSPSQKRAFNLLRYLVPVIFALIMYFIGILILKQAAIYWATVAILFAVIWMIAYPKMYKSLIRNESKKLLKKDNNSECLGKKKMVVTDEDIVVHNDSSTEKTAIDSIKDVKVYDDMILIYTSPVTAHIVPTKYLYSTYKYDLIKKLTGL